MLLLHLAAVGPASTSPASIDAGAVAMLPPSTDSAQIGGPGAESVAPILIDAPLAGVRLSATAEGLWCAARLRAMALLRDLASRPDPVRDLEGILAVESPDRSAFAARASALLADLAAGRWTLAVQWRRDRELQGVNAAYIADDGSGQGRIVLNADRLEAGLFDLDGLTAVLLEESGHGLDHALNGSQDSPGDEGRLFAATVMGEALSADERAVIVAEDDSLVLNLDGLRLLAEASATAFSASAGTYNGTNGTMSYSVTLDATANNGADLLVAMYADTAATTTLIGWQIVNRSSNFAANAVYKGSFDFKSLNISTVDTNAIGVRVWEGTAGTNYGTGNDTSPVITYGNTNIAAGAASGFRPDNSGAPDKTSSVTFTGTPLAGGTKAGFTSSSNSVTVRTVAPTLASPFPTAGATGGLVNNAIVLTFSEAITGGGGTIAIQTGTSSTNTYAMTLVAGASSGSFSSGSGSWQINGQQLFIKPSSTLSSNTTYNVDIDATALRDRDGNFYAGIVSSSTAGVYFTTGTASDTVAPSVSVGSQAATIVEAGGVANAVVGTPTTTISLSRSDAGGGTYFSSSTLTSGGWSSSDGGVTYSKAGSYGSASLAAATGVVTYSLNNAAAATEALTDGQSVTDSFDSLQVLDYANNATTSSTISFQIVGANDAPTLNTAASPLLATIYEGTAAPTAGSISNSTLVSSLLIGLTDPDSANLGMAIQAVNSTAGSLYYSLNDGTSWTSVGSASDSNLLLLASSDRLYFSGASKLSGTVSDAFTFYGWDRSVGTAGSRVFLSSTTTLASDSFASQAYTGGSAWSGNWIETNDDASPTAGDIQLVNTLNAFSLRLSETGNSTTPIIARSVNLSGVSSPRLSFNYQRRGGLTSTMPVGVQASKDGTTWSGDLFTIVGTGTDDTTWQAASVDLSAYASATTQVRFVVSTALSGTTYVYLDDVSISSTVAGSIVGSLSAASDTVAVTLLPVQDAPVLDATPVISAALSAGVPAPSGAVGFLVADLLACASDPDPGTNFGVALIGADQSNGSWFFSRNGGTGWTAFSSLGTLSSSSALLLAGDALSRLYYQPNSGYNGNNATLTFRAWDQSTGSAGSLADTTTNGGATAFSIGTDSLSTRVTGGGVLLQGAASGDRLIGGDAADLLQGSGGADTLSGGSGRDGFFNPIADCTVTIGGSGNSGTIQGFDVISDFRLADGSTSGDGFAESEFLRVTAAGTNAAIVGNGNGTGTASSLTIAGATVKSRTISAGIVQFDDAATYAAPLSLGSEAEVAAVVQYLAANDLGNAGATLAFVTGSYTANNYTGIRTFVYTQNTTNAGSVDGFGLVALRGVAATSLTTTATTTTAGALLISNGLPPTASINPLFSGTEDTSLSLQVSGNALPIFAEADSTANLTVTLTPASGSISATAASGITIAGTAASRTISGTLAALDSYFRTTGITYTPVANVYGSVSLGLGVSDGTSSNSYTSTIQLAPVQDPPLINDASVSIVKTIPIGGSVIDINDANTGTDVDLDGDPLTYAISSDSSSGGFTIAPSTGVLSVVDPSKFNSIAPSTWTVVVSATDGQLSDTATISISVQPTNLTGSANADTLIGSAADNSITALAAADSLSGLDGQDLLQGGSGADTMTGGNNSDSFFVPSGDNSVALGGTGNSGTISGFDVITDYTPASGTAVGEALRVTPVGVSASLAADTTATTGTPSVLTIGGKTLLSHRISGGIISFDDATPWSKALNLNSAATVATAVDYLSRNTLGPAGTVVAFTTSSYNADGFNGVRTFVYTQTGAAAGSSGGYSLISLRGVTAAALSTSPASTTLNTVFISNNLAPLADVPGGWVIAEDVTGNLLFIDTPFTDVDTTGASSSGSLTVTLSVGAGTITGQAATGITLGGTASAPASAAAPAC